MISIIGKMIVHITMQQLSSLVKFIVQVLLNLFKLLFAPRVSKTLSNQFDIRKHLVIKKCVEFQHFFDIDIALVIEYRMM